MKAVIRFIDGYEIQISKLKHITYKRFTDNTVVKIDKFEDFYLRSEHYNFVSEDSNFVASGKDIHFIRFDQQL